MSRTQFAIVGFLVLCSTAFGEESQIDSLIYTDNAGDRILLTFNKVTKQYNEIPYNPDPEPDHLENTPSTAGWCFRIGTGEDAIYWCNEVAWSKWDADDSQWAGISDPHIMLTLDSELESGEFISTDDEKYHAHLESELTPIKWKGVGSPEASGNLGWTSDGTSSAVIFNPDSAPNGRNYAFTYTITARVGKEKETKVITQDNISKLRQQYVDFNRKRWKEKAPTVPGRTEFKSSYSTDNYNFQEYGHGRDLIVMHMGAIAEDIRSNEVDSLKQEGDNTVYEPRMTSGYRYPSDKESKGNPTSLHQYGYAIDFTPHSRYNNDEGRADMLRRTRNLVGVANYDTFLEKKPPHIHIEQQTVAQGGNADE